LCFQQRLVQKLPAPAARPSGRKDRLVRGGRSKGGAAAAAGCVFAGKEEQSGPRPHRFVGGRALGGSGGLVLAGPVRIRSGADAFVAAYGRSGRSARREAVLRRPGIALLGK